MRGYHHSLIALTLAILFSINRPTFAQPAPQAPPSSPTASTAGKRLTAIGWASSFDAALAKARATHKPVMVVFTAPWCVACHFFTGTTCKNARVIAASGDFVNVQVDITKQTAIARRYSATATPSFVWLDSGGHVLNGMEGIGPVSELLQEMQLALNQFNFAAASRRV